MPVTPAKAFEKRCIPRHDGVAVLTRPLITVAALEAGYTLPTPVVDDEVQKTAYPGQMTQEEFEKICEKNADSAVTSQAMASAIVMVAPDNVITRASLEEILSSSSDKKISLSEAEIDLLFDTLDSAHTSAISGDDLMKTLYGPDGLVALQEERLFLTKAGAIKLSYDEQKRKEQQRLEEERKRREEEERRRREEAERQAKLAREKAEREKADREKNNHATKEKDKGCC